MRASKTLLNIKVFNYESCVLTNSVLFSAAHKDEQRRLYAMHHGLPARRIATCAHFQFSAVSALAVSSHRKVRCTAGNTDPFAGVLTLLQKNTTKGKQYVCKTRGFEIKGENIKLIPSINRYPVDS